jgi:hypothetical protein
LKIILSSGLLLLQEKDKRMRALTLALSIGDGEGTAHRTRRTNILLMIC